MAMEFEELLSEIGRAVAKANRMTEVTSLSNYIESGYGVDKPVSEYLHVRDGHKQDTPLSSYDKGDRYSDRHKDLNTGSHSDPYSDAHSDSRTDPYGNNFDRYEEHGYVDRRNNSHDYSDEFNQKRNLNDGRGSKHRDISGVQAGGESYRDENTDGESLAPATLKFQLQGQELEVPVSVLMHNTTMCLDEVDMTIRFHLFQSRGRLMAECSGEDDEDGTLNEMKLHFKNVPPAEGTAKLDERYVRKM